jgi:hypothetical protein
MADAGAPGAFGVNYAIRPHKFVDRRVFVEVISRYSNFISIDKHIYVGLGSFAMEDHKLMNLSFGISPLLSLEIDSDVLKRQQFNTPLSCIKPTRYSTNDFVVRRASILAEIGASPEANSIVWFDMTDATSLRANLDNFGQLLSASQPGDLLRMTVDVDDKTFGRNNPGETYEDLQDRRFAALQELIGAQLRPGATQDDIGEKLGIAKLVSYAFSLVAEEAFDHDARYKFEPISITTYADGHRMLSVTGVIVERDRSKECRERMALADVPGGVNDWQELIEIQIPQLTVWEKLIIDRDVHSSDPSGLERLINFKLHETIPTIDLLGGYQKFQRFYPTFRHVLL